MRITENLMIVGLFLLVGLFIFAFIAHIHQKDCFTETAKNNCEFQNMSFSSFTFDGSDNYFCSKSPNSIEIIGYKFSDDEVNFCIGGKDE